MIPLSTLIQNWLIQIWPNRSQQELLLDLGEHKNWEDRDRDAACRQMALWLQQELGLPESFETEMTPSLERIEVLKALKSLPIPQKIDEYVGVSKLHQKLGTWIGANPKTLANSLNGGFVPSRIDHRWLLLLARLQKHPPSVDALLYHRRTSAAIISTLQHRGGALGLDVADTLLLYSLIALYQRRRPTTEVRASRNKPQSRRELAKPVSKLSGQLLTIGMFRTLMALSQQIEQGAVLAAICVECALTEAHLAPHIASKGDEKTSGEQWLLEIENALKRPNLSEDSELFRFRIQWMRAWRDHEPMPSTHISHPYIYALQQIDAARQGQITQKLDPTDTGVFMLLPQARRRGLVT